MRLTAILLLTILPAVLTAQTTAQSSVEQIMQQSMAARNRMIEARARAIVKVVAEKEVKDNGTGIVLSASPDRILILTAWHVVKGAKNILVTFYDDRATAVPARQLSQFSENLDLAVLEVRPTATVKLPSNIEPLNFAANSTLQLSEHVYSVNGDWVPVPNAITRLSHDGDVQKFEYSNTSVGEGFSGGPVFDDYLNVVGMHDALNGDGSYGIAVKIDSALQTLQALGYTVPQASTSVFPYSMPKPTTAKPATAAGPCSSGCDVKFSQLKMTQQYGSNMNKGRLVADCKERVYQMPKDWPGAGLYLHVKDCDYHSRHAYQMGFGPTDKPEDMDPSKGFLTFTSYSGQGMLLAQGNWQIHLRSETANQIDPDTTLSIAPMGGVVPKP
jgi:hypothetical protein